MGSFIYFSGRRKIHFTFPDGQELAEEYNLKTGELVGMWYVCIFGLLSFSKHYYPSELCGPSIELNGIIIYF